MLLTLILNLGMAAGVVETPIPPTPPSGGGGYVKRKHRSNFITLPNYEKQKKDDEEILKIFDTLIN